ncbi:MAG: DUF5320 domain-containing protein [Syntrophomonadales bacterium]|jgi:hypothetical protein
MPRGDGTGPMGRGSMTGRGLGYCSGADSAGYGIGRGMRPGRGSRRGIGRVPGRGMGRGFGRLGCPATAVPQKDLLQEEKRLLEHRLDLINKELESS